jgi:uncharacterized protein (DUF1697 family)
MGNVLIWAERQLCPTISKLKMTCVVLLFSIGIRDGKRLIMADWREMLAEMGLQNPRTLIATGNAIFECRGTDIAKLEARLEDAYEKRFGRRVHNIVRPAELFRRLVGENPFPKESKKDGSKVMVRVMRQPMTKDLEATLKPYLTQGERVKIVNGDLWMHFKGSSNESKLSAALGSKRMGIGTVRNWNTVRRLGEMVDDGAQL